MNRILKALPLLALLAALVCVQPDQAYAQATMNSTTTSAAVALTDLTVQVTSATNITGVGSLNQPTTYLVIDGESMAVLSVSGTTVSVRRGYQGGGVTTHASGAVVWVGPPNYFLGGAPSGSCTPANIAALPAVVVTAGPSGYGGATGEVYNCIVIAGQTSNQWALQSRPSPMGYTDGYFWQPASDCVGSASGNTTGTNGLTTVGASVAAVMQVQTSATGTNTHTYTCQVHIPGRLTSPKGALITDITFFYGVQTTGLGTQVATLASGTMNSTIVFSKVAFPTAGAVETPSTVTPVRLDSGSLLITPPVASFNNATSTAGAFYSVKFTPAAGLPLNTDLQEVLFSVSLLNTATSATITNSPGFLVHYTYSVI
jgi:hypothetical protein